MNAPVAKKQPKTLSIHGHDRTDDYHWMNQREDPEVIAHLEAENAYFEAQTAGTKELKEELYQEIRGRIKEDDTSVPYTKDGYVYSTKYNTGEQYPIYLRRAVGTEKDEVMLNVNELAKGHDFFSAVGMTVTDDNRYLAYGEDTLSRRIYTIRIKDLKTGHYLPDVIPNTTGGSTWSADGKYLFYSVKDETLRPYKIMRHELGTAPQDDVVVYEEADDTFRAFVYRTKSKKYIVLGAVQTVSAEYYLIPADAPLSEPQLFQARERNLEYSIAHFDDKFYVLTNLNAENFQLMITPENETGKANWETVIAHREDVLLEDVDLFRDFMVISERSGGLVQLRIRPFDGEEYYLEFPESAYVAYTAQNPEFDTQLLRYGYQSMITPPSTYDYDMGSREQELLKQTPVLGGFDSTEYVSERIMIEARDGTLVPVSLAYRKDTPLDGSAPLLEYAYGSYGYSIDPSFSYSRLSLMDRGFVYAIAHIRGGQEMGRRWYEDGKLMKKMNTFTDFIDVGEALIERKYTSQDRLFAMGGSAGGLLMGTVINLRPELYAGVVAAVPFVDVITTMLDDSIPLTTGEYDEWGNPNEKEAYDYILGYSPYDNIEAKAYPNMLVTTGLHDSQVQYWEPAKWVAKLRELKTSDKLLLMHTNMEAGHGGASGRFERLREVARDYAFMIDLASPHPRSLSQGEG